MTEHVSVQVGKLRLGSGNPSVVGEEKFVRYWPRSLNEVVKVPENALIENLT